MKDKFIRFFKNKDNILAIISVCAYYLIMFGVLNLIALLIKAMFSNEFIINNENNINLFMNVVLYILLFSALIPMSLNKLKDDWTQSRNDTASMARYIIIGVIVMYAFSFFASLISMLISNQASTNQEGINTLLSSSKYSYWIMLPIIGFIAPICEELVFRHSIFKICKNDTISIIVSSALFCLIHMTHQEGSARDFIAVALGYLAAGFSFSFIYIYSKKNIWITIICHMINNIISLLLISFII